jgi:tetraacyldisaccharide 4'-kinase
MGEAVSIEGLARRAWYEKRPGVAATALRGLLYPPSILYGATMMVRRAMYERNLLTSKAIPIPVFCIGNLTLGGSGKTPATMLFARMLQKLERRVAVISRGYRGSMEGKTALVSDGEQVFLSSDQAGDEPVMLANALSGVPVLIGADRVAGAQLAIEKTGADCLVLDDAYQHLRIRRDLDVLCVNGQIGFGNGLSFPSGPLRESLCAASRAKVCLMTEGAKSEEAKEMIRAAGFAGEIVDIRYPIDRLVALGQKNGKSAEDYRGIKVGAFCSIAHPEPFFHALEDAGMTLVYKHAFGDHHRYREADLNRLANLANAKSVQYYVTTEKDAAKLNDLGPDIPILAAITRTEISSDSERHLLNLVREVL